MPLKPPGKYIATSKRVHQSEVVSFDDFVSAVVSTRQKRQENGA